MSRATRLLATAAAAPIAIVLAIVLGLLAWGFSSLPSDLRPPDADSVAEHVVSGFERHLDHNRDWYAATLFMTREDRHLGRMQRRVAGITAQLWLHAFWTPRERVAEIARRAYFGHGFFGVESAARGYFGRPNAQLSEEEVAALAFLTRWPSATNPWCYRATFVEHVREIESLAHLEPERMLENLLPAPPGACEPDEAAAPR